MMRIPSCFNCDDLQNEIDALRAQLAAEKEAVRVLGADLFRLASSSNVNHPPATKDWHEDNWSLFVSDSVKTNPIASAAVREAKETA